MEEQLRIVFYMKVTSMEKNNERNGTGRDARRPCLGSSASEGTRTQDSVNARHIHVAPVRMSRLSAMSLSNRQFLLSDGRQSEAGGRAASCL